MKRERESDTAKEYRQRASLQSLRNGAPITPAELIKNDIDNLKDLLDLAKEERREKSKVDQLKRRLNVLVEAEKELNPTPHTENQLIFRDAISVERVVPAIKSGKAFRDFELPDGNILRVRVLHPDRPEHITGAVIIYERHNPREESARIVAIQYKIWDGKTMYLSDKRMQAQLSRLKQFTCDKEICQSSLNENTYRFPCCAGFLRPTDKLQRPDQSFISKGEHLPICRINECLTEGPRGGEALEYSKIRETSLSSEIFEQLFNKAKIGSRALSYDELEDFYEKHQVGEEGDRVIIYA